MNLGKFEYMYIKNTNWINAYVHVLWTLCTKWFVQCLHQRVVYYRPWFCENSLLSVTTLVKPVSGSYTRVTAPWTWPFVDLKVPKVQKKAAYYWFVQNFSYIWMQKEFWNGDANIIKKKKFLRACNIWLCCSYLNIKTAVMYIYTFVYLRKDTVSKSLFIITQVPSSTSLRWSHVWDNRPSVAKERPTDSKIELCLTLRNSVILLVSCYSFI